MKSMPFLLVKCMAGIMLYVLSGDMRAAHSISVVEVLGGEVSCLSLWNILLLPFPHIILQFCKTSGAGPVGCKDDAEQLVLWKITCFCSDVQSKGRTEQETTGFKEEAGGIRARRALHLGETE